MLRERSEPVGNNEKSRELAVLLAPIIGSLLTNRLSYVAPSRTND